MQIAFVELTEATSGSTGWVNVEQIASVVPAPGGEGTIVSGSFGNVVVADTPQAILDKIANTVNLVNGDID
ncbi:hypothetical protein SEA_DELORIS_35 [Mycobacterium phage Deloris]|nr:hypothetical protein SEA_DELORIS_35 [Mycobacterium phage Deloris]